MKTHNEGQRQGAAGIPARGDAWLENRPEDRVPIWPRLRALFGLPAFPQAPVSAGRNARSTLFAGLAFLTSSFFLLSSSFSQVPNILTYQGRIEVNSAPFHGTGQFRFALVDAAGTTTYWSNDGTSTGGGQPTAAVASPVNQGAANVLVGDPNPPLSMTPIPASVFTTHSDVRLRVWFHDGTMNGIQRLEPDQRVVAAGYAFVAGTVPDGAITTAKLASGSLTGSNFASGTLTGSNFAAGTLTGSNFQNGSIGATALAAGAISANQLEAGAIAANLQASGQSGVPSGGILLSLDPSSSSLLAAGYVRIGASGESPDGWGQTLAQFKPSPRTGHTGVWTGSEWIVWGGYTGSGPLADGARYDPVTDAWSVLPTNNAPLARTGHTAVWTGTQMVVWGGTGAGGLLGSGGIYDRATETWRTLGLNGAPPTARSEHTAVYSGGVMVVWGGRDATGPVASGGRCTVAGGNWAPVSTTSAPSARSLHTTVLTSAPAASAEMIVWGGSGTSVPLADGARYAVQADTWTALPTTGAPTARFAHSAVWAGTRMLVWGGRAGSGLVSTGASIIPGEANWTALSDTGAPAKRGGHTAVWAAEVGSMLVYGGYGNAGFPAEGGRYHAASNTWLAMDSSTAPSARYGHTAAWTDANGLMLVFGGEGSAGVLADGGRYSPSNTFWTPLAASVVPAARGGHTAVWTGTEMIVFGGYLDAGFAPGGARFNASTNRWTTLPTESAPAARGAHTAVWTAGFMVVWGGVGSSGYLNTGGRYSPGTDQWSSVATTPAAPNTPSARERHTAVSTGSEMLIWGGRGNAGYLNTGARYDPVADTWTALPTPLAATLAAREGHGAVWSGSELVIWGGVTNAGLVGTGARLRLDTGTWATLPTGGAPSARQGHTAVSNGNEMLVWGGYGSASSLADGARYNFATQAWTTIATTGTPPTARGSHTAVWTGEQMIVWGGYGSAGLLDDGARYSVLTNIWTTLPRVAGPSTRQEHTALWTGTEMWIWGGYGPGGVLGDTVHRYRLPAPLYLYARP